MHVPQERQLNRHKPITIVKKDVRSKSFTAKTPRTPSLECILFLGVLGVLAVEDFYFEGYYP